MQLNSSSHLSDLSFLIQEIKRLSESAAAAAAAEPRSSSSTADCAHHRKLHLALDAFTSEVSAASVAINRLQVHLAKSLGTALLSNPQHPHYCVTIVTQPLAHADVAAPGHAAQPLASAGGTPRAAMRVEGLLTLHDQPLLITLHVGGTLLRQSNDCRQNILCCLRLPSHLGICSLTLSSSHPSPSRQCCRCHSCA